MHLFLLKAFIKIRWAYFHVSPMYLKFYMTADEPWFQHKRNGSIHCNYTIIDTGKVNQR